MLVHRMTEMPTFDSLVKFKSDNLSDILVKLVESALNNYSVYMYELKVLPNDRGIIINTEKCQYTLAKTSEGNWACAWVRPEFIEPTIRKNSGGFYEAFSELCVCLRWHNYLGN